MGLRSGFIGGQYELRLARNAKRTPKSYFNYVRSDWRLRVAVDNVHTKTGGTSISADHKVDPSSLLGVGSRRCLQHHPRVTLIAHSPKNGRSNNYITKVASILRRLDNHKAAGPNSVHTAIVKPLIDLGDPHLMDSFYRSPTAMESPKSLRMEKVASIQKRRNRNDRSNRHPITLP